MSTSKTGFGGDAGVFSNDGGLGGPGEGRTVGVVGGGGRRGDGGGGERRGWYKEGPKERGEKRDLAMPKIAGNSVTLGETCEAGSREEPRSWGRQGRVGCTRRHKGRMGGFGREDG